MKKIKIRITRLVEVESEHSFNLSEKDYQEFLDTDKDDKVSFLMDRDKIKLDNENFTGDCSEEETEILSVEDKIKGVK